MGSWRAPLARDHESSAEWPARDHERAFHHGPWFNKEAPSAANVLNALARDAAGFEDARDFDDWLLDMGDTERDKAWETYKQSTCRPISCAPAGRGSLRGALERARPRRLSPRRRTFMVDELETLYESSYSRVLVEEVPRITPRLILISIPISQLGLVPCRDARAQ